MAEMTVRETLEFSGRCQGVGIKYGGQALSKIMYMFVSDLKCGPADMKSFDRYAFGAIKKRKTCWDKT